MNFGSHTQRTIDNRGHASALWRAWHTNLVDPDPRIPSEMPGYFVDRYAFALAQHNEIPGLPGFAVEQVDAFVDTLDQQWVPAVTLCNWTPRARDEVCVSPFYESLLEEWLKFVTRYELTWLSDAAPSVVGKTWEQLSADSVFFPRMPAIPGANYFDMLSNGEREFCVGMYGSDSPIDFFVFMLQLHESIHRRQTGEPLANEVIQSTIWTSFLDFAGLWSFQRDLENGTSPVLERELVRKARAVWEAVRQHGPDTAAVIEGVAGPNGYFRLCRLGAAFDSGAMHYKGYLRSVGELLAP